MTSQID